MRTIGLAALLAAAVAIPTSAALSSRAASAATPMTTSGQLFSVSCTSPSFCMAVGTTYEGVSTLTESWNGTVWSVIPSPNPSTTINSLNSVSCTSPANCVAVGEFYTTATTYQGLIESWDGTTWSVVSAASPVPSGDNTGLNGVSCTNSTFCIAVGFSGNSTGESSNEPLVESWDGTGWSFDSTPPPEYGNGVFENVSCSSSTSCMTVGYTVECGEVMGQPVCFSSQMLVESWDGTTWSINTTPNEDGSDFLDAVSCTGSESCVAIGVYNDSSTGLTETLAESWNGTTWSVVYGPSFGTPGGAVGNLSCISFTDCEAVGSYSAPSPGVESQTWAAAWNGTALSVVPSANPNATSDQLNGVSCISPTLCFAVGSEGSSQTLIETWNGTDWSVPPTISILVPSSGTALSGTSAILDAAASNATSVEVLLFGGIYGFAAPVICTATPTYYGWVCVWNTTTVPNGSYVLVSLASNSAGSTFSSGVSVTVNNPLPTTAVLIPSKGATLSGSTYVDASASNATSVRFLLFGGIYGYSAPVICTATLTLYGWLCDWNTTTVPNGSYVLVSLASNSVGNTFSSGVSATVDN
jgi:hypothetical protein